MAANFESRDSDSGFAIVPKHILSQPLEDEVILLDTNGGTYFSLNEVASLMWILIQEKRDLDTVLDAMLQEYDVEEAKLRTDLMKFVDNLASQGFIQTRNGSSA